MEKFYFQGKKKKQCSGRKYFCGNSPFYFVKDFHILFPCFAFWLYYPSKSHWHRFKTEESGVVLTDLSGLKTFLGFWYIIPSFLQQEEESHKACAGVLLAHGGRLGTVPSSVDLF